MFDKESSEGILDLNNNDDQFLNELGTILNSAERFDPTSDEKYEPESSDKKLPFEYNENAGPMEKAQL